jgi:hypothetical protein
MTGPHATVGLKLNLRERDQLLSNFYKGRRAHPTHFPLPASAAPARPMTAPMPRPRASHPRQLRGNVGHLRRTLHPPPQVASLPGSQIASPAARPGGIEWRSFRQSAGQPISGQNRPG